MTLKKKWFDELTIRELYEILRARVAVFVVEQQCTAQEVDGRDYSSFHVFYECDDGSVAACLRIFERGSGTVQIGRVLTVEHGQGLGRKLLHEGVLEARKLGPKRIVLEAQSYAVGFYEKEGFRVCSEEFLEDGIPHVWMELLNGIEL